MAKEFERRAVDGKNRLIKSTCRICQHPVAASRDKTTLRIAEEAHLRSNQQCGQAAKTSAYEPEDAPPHRPSHRATH